MDSPLSTSTKNSIGDKTREAILQSALDEFAAYGFEGASIRRIESRADMTHGHIRYHFKSKEKLWIAAVELMFERSLAIMQPTVEEMVGIIAGDIHIIRGWIRRYVGYCGKHPEHARIMFQETGLRSARLRFIIERYIKSTNMLALHFINQLIGNGSLPKSITPVSAVYVILGSAQSFFALSDEVNISLGINALSEEAIEAHATTVVDMLLPLPDNSK